MVQDTGHDSREPRDEELFIRVSNSLKTQTRVAAAKRGESISEYVRCLIRRDTKTEEPKHE